VCNFLDTRMLGARLMYSKVRSNSFEEILKESNRRNFVVVPLLHHPNRPSDTDYL
jgi:hypothetical protein